MKNNLKKYDIEKCSELFLNFLNKEFKSQNTLKDKLEQFKNWSFSWLYYDKIYGMLHKNEPFDEDATILANIIYLIIYHDLLPGLNTLEDINGIKYRGETINTFNWLFQDNLLGIKTHIPFTDANKDFYFQVLKFREKYTTLGNFMLLPNFSADNQTLNKLKGSKRYYDYSDLFFTDLYPDGKLTKNNSFQKIINSNKKYLPETFEEFCRIYFLGNHYIKNGKPYNKFHQGGKTCFWSMNDTTYEDYKNFANNYMKIATDIIEKRACEICLKLEQYLQF